MREHTLMIQLSASDDARIDLEQVVRDALRAAGAASAEVLKVDPR